MRLFIVRWIAEKFFDTLDLDLELLGHLERMTVIAVILLGELRELKARDLAEFLKDEATKCSFVFSFHIILRKDECESVGENEAVGGSSHSKSAIPEIGSPLIDLINIAEFGGYGPEFKTVGFELDLTQILHTEEFFQLLEVGEPLISDLESEEEILVDELAGATLVARLYDLTGTKVGDGDFHRSGFGLCHIDTIQGADGLWELEWTLSQVS